MFKILQLYGIPSKIVEAIRALYINTTATIISPGGETDAFEVMAGVLQGDTIAPFLFIVVLDYVLRISHDNIEEKWLWLTPRQSSRHPAQYLTALDFADDLGLITRSINDAEYLLQALEQAANQVGLHCNESKTEYLSTSPESSELKSLNGSTTKRVKDFKYLGSQINGS